MSTLPTLSARLGRDVIERAVDAHAAGHDDDPTIGKVIQEAFRDHLLALRDAGVVKPHVATPNRRINEIEEWNIMCGVQPSTWATPEKAAEGLARRLSHNMVTIHLLMASFGIKDGRDRKETIDDAIRSIDSGSTRSHLSHMECQDHVGGDDLSFRMQDWNPVLFLKQDVTMADIMSGRRLPDVPAPDIEPTALRTVELDMASGDVALGDWFRMEGFTDHVDEGDPYRGGSERESEADSRRYVADHGFTSVRSSRTSYEVVTDGRIHAAIRWDEDERDIPDGFRSVGRLGYDLRQITVMDRSALQTIMERLHDPAKAVQLTEEGLTAPDMLRLSLPAGRYAVHHSGRGWIEDLLPPDHPLVQDGVQVLMILEPVDDRETARAEA